KYTATAGLMPLKDENGSVEAHIFYIAYTLDDVDHAKRPLTFAFNGGPGSASIWVHLGCMGPKRIKMQADGGMPAPPYHLEDNPYTWLDQTDLVFIDPVGTGYSRPAKPELGKKFWGLQGDIASVGQFIRLYMTEYDRWVSPLFLAGESYGTTRSAGLAGYLIDHGVAFNGIILISTVLNFETLLPARGNDLPYILYLPSFTSTAWYHKKLPSEMQQKSVEEVVAESEKWAGTDYVIALQRGDSLTPQERQDVINKLAAFTGLDKGLIDDANLRITGALFEKNLLHGEKKTTGRLDSRFVGVDELAIGTRPEFDPSSVAIRPPFTAMFSNYIKTELNYKSDLEYYALGGGVRGWDWGSDNRFADTSEALRSAFAQNPDMKLFVAMGYYDLATPLFAVQYTLNHMNINAGLKHNISEGYYEAGHMMYIDNKSIAKLRRDVSTFIDSAVATEPERGGLDAPVEK
ncbi:MAG: S10 family peptidase, partial [Blastocatellia bacterium]